MKILIASDIHGSLYYLNKLLNVYNDIKPDKFILLGDLYYHGPRNNLPMEYNPMEVSMALNNINKDKKLYVIKGNCDAEVDQMISLFKFRSGLKLTINNKKFYFTHGHKYNIDNVYNGCDILVYGHFHTGFIKEKDGKVFVNSGSISLPKNNTKNSYLVIEDNNIKLLDFDNNIIDSYKF